MKAYMAELGHVGYGTTFVSTDRAKLIEKVLSEGRMLHDPWPPLGTNYSKELVRLFIEGQRETVQFDVSAPAVDGKGEPIMWCGKPCAYTMQVSIRVCEVIP